MRVVSITGASGVGKTTLQEALINLGYTRVVSNTTRERRNSDVSGEYRYCNEAELRNLPGQLWLAKVHGKLYTTLRDDLLASAGSGLGAVIVHSIEYLSRLKNFCRDSVLSHTAIHLLSPGEDILRNRMLQRGDSRENVEVRIRDCLDWDTRAQQVEAVHFITPSNPAVVLERTMEILQRPV